MSRKSLILFALGLFALALYAAGIKTGAFILFGAALVVELLFWIKIYKNNNVRKSDSE